MVLYSKTYRLGAFQEGNVFDSAVDAERMLIIDHQMEFISSMIGDGVLSGWNIGDDSSTSEFAFYLTKGYGFIDKHAVYTYGDIEFTLSDNNVHYIYLQKKNGIVGGLSGLSNSKSITYSDSVTTTDVTGFSVDSYDYNYVILSWNSNPEPDIDYYALERSLDNIVWAEIARPETNSYTDSSVEDNTIYYYRIKAVDINGNESVSYTILSPAFIKTSKDLSQPADPSFLLKFPQDGQVELVWDTPEVGNVNSYRVEYVRVDSEYNEIGASSSSTTSNTRIIIDGLNNEFVYKFTLYAVSEFGIDSEGISVFASPKEQTGPSEVVSLIIQDIASTNNDTGIALNISWENLLGPYLIPSNKYEITIIENGSITSQPIISTSTSKVVEVYVGTDGISRDIKPRTNYTVLVKGINSSGVKNNGVVGTIDTTNFKDPNTPKNLISFESDNGDLIFIWTNSSSVFSYNEINLVANDGTTLTNIESATNYGKANSYILEFDNTALATTYTFSVRAFDEFGNFSDLIQSSIETISADEVPSNPDVPAINAVYSNDNVVTLGFEPPEVNNIYAQYYKIWRSPFKFNLVPTDFELIDTIAATETRFDDYSVVNNQGYYYFVTTVDRYGNESLNPVDDLFISYSKAKAYPHPNISFESPSEITVSSSGYDATISWTPSSDSFDGYEILRSKGDVFNFEVVGSVVKEIGYFVDEDALLEDGEIYYYAIRKYRNEAKVLTKTSATPVPESSILIATITISNGDVTIDYQAEDRTNLQFAAVDNVSQRIDDHVHSLTDSYDLRIDLADNVIVDDWTTTNNILFSTEQDISAGTNFIVKIDGQLPSVFYSIDPNNSTLVFSSAVTGSITVEVIGVNEVKNTIHKDRVNSVFASQVESGTILANQFDTYNHRGRIEEKIKPLQFKMVSKDGYKFRIYQNDFTDSSSQEVVTNAITFYDIIAVGDLSFLSWALLSYEEWSEFLYEEWFYLELGDVVSFVAATSQGLMVSFDLGLNWQSLRNTDYPAHKIYSAEVLSYYFALSGNDVYISKNGLSWVKMNGLENASFCKDITEDELGNVYVSTDVGVFKLDQSDLGDQLVWQHAAFASAESSDCYGIWYDGINAELLLSNEVSLFRSTDEGDTWVEANEIDNYGIVHSFHEETLEYATYVYAVQDNYVWRKNSLSATFDQIAYVESELRRIEIYDNRIVLTSSDGFLISKSTYDPYSDTDIEFDNLELVDQGNNRVESTCLAEVGGRLYLGTDSKLIWTNDFDTARGSYELSTAVNPSAYVNGDKKKIGVYYGQNEVFFDKPQRYEDSISVANQYVAFYLDNKGWADQNYQSPVRIFNNNVLLAELNPSDFPFPSTQFNDVVFETFTASTYNVSTAEEAKTNYQSELSKAVSFLSGVSSVFSADETIESVTANIIRYFYKVYANKFGNIKFNSSVTIDGNIYSVVDNELVLSFVLNSVYPDYDFVDFIDPVLVQYQNLVQVDMMNGTFGFLSEYDKYDDLEINIDNVYFYNAGENTHEEIEDAFELINSGLPSRVAQISQDALLKQGLFIERTFGKEHTTPIDPCEYAKPLQANYIISDNQSWYDQLNSTVDYEEEQAQNDLNVSISYPIAVACLESLSQIWVGGLEGLISIDKDTDDVAEIDFNDGKLSEEVRDIFITGSSVYVVTPKNVYLTTNGGGSWGSVFTGGTSGLFNKITKIKNNLVIFSDEGIFYKNNAYDEWQVASSTITSVNFVDNSDLIYAFSGNQMYTSANGITWQTKTNFGDLDVNDIRKYRGIFLAATSEGLRSDGATFYGNTSSLSVIDVASDISISQSLYMNDVDADSDNQIMLAGQNNGDYWVFSSGSWVQNTDSYLDTIHKVLLIDQQPWLFGFNMFKSPNSTTPKRLVEAAVL